MSSIFQKIIVASNATPEAERAVEAALSLAEGMGAKLILLAVVASPSAEAQAEGYALEDPTITRRKLDSSLAQIVEAAKARGIDAVTEVIEGDPEKQIEQRAREEQADLIVIGHRNVSTLRHWLERSTGEALLKHAKTSVLIVHTPEAKL